MLVQALHKRAGKRKRIIFSFAVCIVIMILMLLLCDYAMVMYGEVLYSSERNAVLHDRVYLKDLPECGGGRLPLDDYLECCSFEAGGIQYDQCYRRNGNKTGPTVNIGNVAACRDGMTRVSPNMACCEYTTILGSTSYCYGSGKPPSRNIRAVNVSLSNATDQYAVEPEATVYRVLGLQATCERSVLKYQTQICERWQRCSNWEEVSTYSKAIKLSDKARFRSICGRSIIRFKRYLETEVRIDNIKRGNNAKVCASFVRCDARYICSSSECVFD